MEEKDFGSIDQKLVVQIVAGIIIGSTKTENVLKLTGERVRDNWSNIEEAIKATVDFLSTEIKCVNIDFLPFHQQLVPIARFYSKTKRVSTEQVDILKKFFWRTSFSDRYSTGQTTAKMDMDIEFMDGVIDYDYSSLDKYQVTYTENDFVETQFSKANPTTRAFLLLSAQNSPKDLANGNLIDIGQSLASFNRKQYHHVFPNSFLNKKGISKKRRFSLVNFCFLPSDSNKKISNKSPSDYFYNIVPQDKKIEILESNLLPTEDTIYQNNEFDVFLEERSKLIMNMVNRFI